MCCRFYQYEIERELNRDDEFFYKAQEIYSADMMDNDSRELLLQVYHIQYFYFKKIYRCTRFKLSPKSSTVSRGRAGVITLVTIVFIVWSKPSQPAYQHRGTTSLLIFIGGRFNMTRFAMVTGSSSATMVICIAGPAPILVLTPSSVSGTTITIVVIRGSTAINVAGVRKVGVTECTCNSTGDGTLHLGL